MLYLDLLLWTNLLVRLSALRSLKSVRTMVVSMDGFSNVSEDILSGVVFEFTLPLPPRACKVSQRDF